MISKRHWFFASSLAASIHIGAFFAVFYSPSEGSVAAGSQGIEFDLGMIGDTGVAEQTSAAQEEVKEAEEVLEEPIVEPEPEPEPIVEPEPEPIVEPEPVEIKQESPVVVEKVISEPIVKLTPEPAIEPETEVKPEKKKAAVKEQPKPVAQASAANLKVTTGSANAATSGGSVGASTSYLNRVASILASKKQYSKASRRRKEEADITVSFIVYSDGSVADVKLINPSKYKRLNRAVLEMVRNSIPLPSFPDDMNESELEIILPVSFKVSNLQQGN